MREIRRFNIAKLLDAISPRRKKCLRHTLFKPSKSNNYGDMEIDVVINGEAEFINLFGVSVDLKTGNIALGLFPRPNEYICCGNIGEVLSNVWFGTKKMPKYIDLRYILQLLKLDPIYYQDEIVQDIFYNLDSEKVDIDGKSISRILINMLRKESGKLKIIDKFRNLTKGNDFIPETIIACSRLMFQYEDMAKVYYGNFASEQYFSEMSTHHGKSLKECLTSAKPNLEALTLRYLDMGIPEVFLDALKSYGFSIKDRENLLNRGRSYMTNNPLSSYSNSEVCDIGIALGSLLYVRNNVKKELTLAYNFMNLVKAINREQDVIFSVDVIETLKDNSPWTSLMNTFHVYDILKEQGLSETEFFMGVRIYIQSVLNRIDWGTCYNRIAARGQYGMVSFAPGQLENAGRVLDLTMSTLKKHLNL